MGKRSKACIKTSEDVDTHKQPKNKEYKFEVTDETEVPVPTQSDTCSKNKTKQGKKKKRKSEINIDVEENKVVIEENFNTQELKPIESDAGLINRNKKTKNKNKSNENKNKSKLPKKIVFSDDSLQQEDDVKDEDIDNFCDELTEEDNGVYENWIQLLETKLGANKKIPK